MILLMTPMTLQAACEKDPECADPSTWENFTHVVLKQSFLGSPEVTEWDASFDHNGVDALINANMSGSSDDVTGTIALVGGRVMMSKGHKLDPGYEIDALDAPILSIKLMMIILDRVFPKGPAELSGHRNIDYTDPVGIKFATASASGYIPAPWQVTGEVTKVKDDQVTFNLELTFAMEPTSDESNTFTTSMTGELSMLGRPVFLDTDSLEGWTIYGVGPRKIKQSGTTILDYGATPEEGVLYKTVGDVRAFINAENDPGVRDSTKDFTGFWKEECNQAFGLQIMHQGSEGKYSIVFCGPGGCGDPSTSRLTFISGDKQYEVVSEDELVSIGRSGDRQTYYRCTEETHPVLKYSD